MSFLPKIFAYHPAPQLLYGVLNGTTVNFVSCSHGQSLSRLTATFFVCRRHLSLLPNSSHLLVKTKLPHPHRDIIYRYQQPYWRTRNSRIIFDEATKTLILSRSGLPMSPQRWFSIGSSCHSNDLPTIVKIVRL